MAPAGDSQEAAASDFGLEASEELVKPGGRIRRRPLRLDLSDSDDADPGSPPGPAGASLFEPSAEAENLGSCNSPDPGLEDAPPESNGRRSRLRSVSRKRSSPPEERLPLPKRSIAALIGSKGALATAPAATATASTTATSLSSLLSLQSDPPSPSLTPLSATPASSTTSTSPSSPPSSAAGPPSSSAPQQQEQQSSRALATPAAKKSIKLTFDSPMSPPLPRGNKTERSSAAASRKPNQRASAAVRQPVAKRRRIAVLLSDSDSDSNDSSMDDVQEVSPLRPTTPRRQRKSSAVSSVGSRSLSAAARASGLLASVSADPDEDKTDTRTRTRTKAKPAKDDRDSSSDEDLPDDHPEPAASSAQLWVDKYRPRSVGEVCMHKQKIAQVREWIEARLRELRAGGVGALRQKALILSGPPGCGKSTLVQALADELGLHVQTWNPPVLADRRTPQQGRLGFDSLAGNSDYSSGGGGSGFYQGRESWSNMGDLRLPHETNLEHFRQFCLRSARYNALPLLSTQPPAPAAEEQENDAAPPVVPGETHPKPKQENGTPSGPGPVVDQREIIDLVGSDSDEDAAAAPPRPPPLPPPKPALEPGAQKLIVLEEYPFFGSSDEGDRDQLSRAKQAFNEALLQILPRARSLFVFLVSTENENQLFSLGNMFTQELLDSPWVSRIACNPVYAKIMKDCLSRILQREAAAARRNRRGGPGLQAELTRRLGPNYLNQLVENSRGDLRQAIQSLQFAASAEAHDPDAVPPAAARGTSIPNLQGKDQVDRWGRVLGVADPKHSMIHGMGRILYAKRDEATGCAALEPVAALQACDEAPEILNAYLHHNSIPTILSETGVASASSASSASVDISDVAEMLHDFSAGDVLLKGSERRFGNSTSACPSIVSSAVCAWSYLGLRMRSGAPSLSPSYVRPRSRPGASRNEGRASFGTKGNVSSRVSRLAQSRALAALRLFRTPSCPQLFPGALEARVGSVSSSSSSSSSSSASSASFVGSSASALDTLDEPDPEDGPDTAQHRYFPPARQSLLLEVLPQLAVMLKHSRRRDIAASLPPPHSHLLLKLLTNFSLPGRPSPDSLAEFKVDGDAEHRALAWRDPLWQAPQVVEIQRKRLATAPPPRGRVQPPVPTFSQPMPLEAPSGSLNQASSGQAPPPDKSLDSFGLDSLDEAALLNIDFEAVTQGTQGTGDEGGEDGEEDEIEDVEDVDD